MTGRKLGLAAVVIVTFCAGYVVSSALSVGVGKERYSPKIVVMKVIKSKGGKLAYHTDGKEISRDKLAEFLRDTALSAGFLGVRIAGPANCRVVIQTGNEIRWSDVMDVVDYCGKNCIQDVYLECENISMPICFDPHPLDYFHRSPKHPPPSKVMLELRWVGRSGNKDTVSEDGRLYLTAREIRGQLLILKEGELVPDPKDKPKVIKTYNFNSLSSLLTEEFGHNIKALVSVKGMVPVSDLLQVMRGCLRTNGGYKLLASK
jgi:hypothetical protein